MSTLCTSVLPCSDFDDHRPLLPTSYGDIQRWERHCRLRREALGNPGLGHSFPRLDHQYSQSFSLPGLESFHLFCFPQLHAFVLCNALYLNEIHQYLVDPVFFYPEVTIGGGALNFPFFPEAKIFFWFGLSPPSDGFHGEEAFIDSD
ncbi:hypothetical protein Tco_0497517 [Tanacetum coccineum]